MKPFNLEQAKAGKPVCTRDGRDVSFLCVDKEGGDYPVIAKLSNNRHSIYSFMEDGSFISTKFNHENDLFMKAEKKEGWINLLNSTTTYSCVYPYESEALSSAGTDVIATIKIEWEE